MILGPAYPLRGGIASFNESMAIALQKRGHQVCIFSFSRQYPSFLFPGKNQFAEPGNKPSLEIRNLLHGYNPAKWPKAVREGILWKPDALIVRFWLPLMAPSLVSVARSVSRKTNAPVFGLADEYVL